MTPNDLTVYLGVFWETIDTAPKDGSLILCAWAGQKDIALLMWKFNDRTGTSYFGDPDEWDDYAIMNEQPTHWFKLPPIPDA